MSSFLGFFHCLLQLIYWMISHICATDFLSTNHATMKNSCHNSRLLFIKLQDDSHGFLWLFWTVWVVHLHNLSLNLGTATRGSRPIGIHIFGHRLHWLRFFCKCSKHTLPCCPGPCQPRVSSCGSHGTEALNSRHQGLAEVRLRGSRLH